MASVNKVILIGNLGADPDTKFTAAGKQVTDFRIATSFKAGDQEKTEWHRIVAWDKNAEIASKYLSKGNPVYIEGRLQTRDYEDKDGNKRYATEVVVERLQLLGGKPADKPEPAEESKPKRSGGGRKPKVRSEEAERDEVITGLEEDPFSA